MRIGESDTSSRVEDTCALRACVRAGSSRLLVHYTKEKILPNGQKVHRTSTRTRTMYIVMKDSFLEKVRVKQFQNFERYCSEAK